MITSDSRRIPALREPARESASTPSARMPSARSRSTSAAVRLGVRPTMLTLPTGIRSTSVRTCSSACGPDPSTASASMPPLAPRGSACSIPWTATAVTAGVRRVVRCALEDRERTQRRRVEDQVPEPRSGAARARCCPGRCDDLDAGVLGRLRRHQQELAAVERAEQPRCVGLDVDPVRSPTRSPRRLHGDRSRRRSRRRRSPARMPRPQSSARERSAQRRSAQRRSAQPRS